MEASLNCTCIGTLVLFDKCVSTSHCILRVSPQKFFVSDHFDFESPEIFPLSNDSGDQTALSHRKHLDK